MPPLQASKAHAVPAHELPFARRVIEGVACLLAVAVIWVAAGELVQYLYDSGGSGSRLPFFLTWVNVSEFMVLLPLKAVRERWEVAVPLPGWMRQLPGCGHRERVVVSRRLPPTDWRAAAKAAALVCPLWFLAQGSYNWSLAGTSVSSSTVLSTTSCVFTFALSVTVLRERFAWLKLGGVMVTLAGAAMVSFSDLSEGARSGNTWWGDALAVFSAAMYGAYTTAIRRFVPDDGRVSMGVFFGFLGLMTALALSPIVGALHAAHVEDLTVLTPRFVALMLVKGAFDNVLSDLLWARAIMLTSPTVATVALSLTIPIAMLADLAISRRVPAPLMAAGAVAVAAGFIVSTVSLDRGGGASAGANAGREVVEPAEAPAAGTTAIAAAVGGDLAGDGDGGVDQPAAPR